MLFSIITPTSNSDKYLNDHLNSVRLQKLKDLEHIFIDNKSEDDTLKILKKYKKDAPFSVKIYSRKDSGIYHAFNKGLDCSKGKIITILNSDDFFSNQNILHNVKKKFEESNCDFLYGDISIVSRDKINKKIRNWKSKYIQNGEFYKVPHPSFFLKKKFKENNNLKFNTKYKIASDLDFIIRCFKKSNNFYYFNKELVRQRSGGTSQKILNIFKSNFEVYKILYSNNIYNKLFFLSKKIIFKVCQL